MVMLEPQIRPTGRQYDLQRVDQSTWIIRDARVPTTRREKRRRLHRVQRSAGRACDGVDDPPVLAASPARGAVPTHVPAPRDAPVAPRTDLIRLRCAASCGGIRPGPTYRSPRDRPPVDGPEGCVSRDRSDRSIAT